MGRDNYFGRLNKRQTERVAELVAGKTVWDLGCGHGQLSRELMRLGAAQVVAIDSIGGLWQSCEGVRYIQADFGKLDAAPLPQPDVAFVSWPSLVAGPGLPRLVNLAPIAIYLGCNDWCVACGDAELWAHFYQREKLYSITSKRNDLFVYGRQLEEPRAIAGAEHHHIRDSVSDLVQAWETRP